MRTHLQCVSAPEVLCLRGDLRLYGCPEADARITTAYRQVVRGQAGALLLDISGITHLDSAGMAALARIVGECRVRSVKLRAYLPGGSLGHVLRVVRIFGPNTSQN